MNERTRAVRNVIQIALAQRTELERSTSAKGLDPWSGTSSPSLRERRDEITNEAVKEIENIYATDRWKEVRVRFNEVMSHYIDIGSSGMLALAITFAPLNHRYLEGERTEELFNEMGAVE